MDDDEDKGLGKLNSVYAALWKVSGLVLSPGKSAPKRRRLNGTLSDADGLITGDGFVEVRSADAMDDN